MAIQYWSEKEKKTITEDFFKSFFLYVRATVAEPDRFWSALTSVPTLYNVHMLHKWRLVNSQICPQTKPSDCQDMPNSAMEKKKSLFKCVR